MSDVHVARVGPGVYRVDADGRTHIVYVAGPAADPWAFCEGRTFHGEIHGSRAAEPSARRTGASQRLAAPMPATVVQVLVQAGATVTAGETLVVLEAMKMELPLRAPSDGVVAVVHCHEGELVGAGAVLVELT
jgi:biotin carboxyl carrier protein